MPRLRLELRPVPGRFLEAEHADHPDPVLAVEAPTQLSQRAAATELDRVRRGRTHGYAGSLSVKGLGRLKRQVSGGHRQRQIQPHVQ
jgi:hypothetical protein